MDRHSHHKSLIAPLRQVMYDFDLGALRRILTDLSTPETAFRLCFPFETTTGAAAYVDKVYAPLSRAVPDLERRDHIVIAGQTPEGEDWVGSAGAYTGIFAAPWLGIPPTGHVVHMRFHEFYRIAQGRITEMQALWDLPEVMMQAGVWPMGPSLGRDWHVPGPATCDGLVPGPHDPEASAVTCQHVIDMLAHMVRHPAEGGPEVMQMDRFWHPRMMWYGPAGIGTARGIAGFRNWHQIPFLQAMPDRGQHPAPCHFFADGPYAAVTGWPNMVQTLSHGGWLGIAPSGAQVTLRSLDFWRLEAGLIRENWVLVDLLHLYDQIGVDVLARMRDLARARPGAGAIAGKAM